MKLIRPVEPGQWVPGDRQVELEPLELIGGVHDDARKPRGIAERAQQQLLVSVCHRDRDPFGHEGDARGMPLAH